MHHFSKLDKSGSFIRHNMSRRGDLAIKMSFFSSPKIHKVVQVSPDSLPAPKSQQAPRGGLRAAPRHLERTPGPAAPARGGSGGASPRLQEPRRRPPPPRCAAARAPRPAGWTPEGAQPHRPQPAPAPWARAPLRTARRARPRRLYSLPMAAAGRPPGAAARRGLPRLSLSGWAPAPRPTRSGGCAQTPPRITWRACGSRSPAPGAGPWAPAPTSGPPSARCAGTGGP